MHRLSCQSLRGPIHRYLIGASKESPWRYCQQRQLRSRPQKSLPKQTTTVQPLGTRETVLSFLDQRLGLTLTQQYRWRDLNIASQILLNGIYMKVDFQTIQEKGRLEDSFTSWLSVTYLHVWMLFVKLKQHGRDGKIMIKLITKVLWEDIEARAKKIENELEQNLSVKKQMKTYISLLQTSFLYYDWGLLKCDATLAQAVWMQIYDCKQQTDIRSIEVFVQYIRYHVARLDHIPMENLVLDPENIEWPLPNRFGNLWQLPLSYVGQTLFN